MHNKLQHAFRTNAALTSVILLALILSGCTVGPNYHRPVVNTPTVFPLLDSSIAGSSSVF
jgi:outer membrane protein, multidrug efflux system